MNLLNAPAKTELVITAIHMDSKTLKRLAALGVCLGASISIFESQWGASIVFVKDSKLALDHQTSKSIEVDVKEGGTL